MREAFSLFLVCIYPLSILLLYYIIKFAVKNGVKEANRDLIDSLRSIEGNVKAIKNAS